MTDLPPLLPNAWSDEFDVAVLSGAWTELDQGNSVLITPTAYGLESTLNGTNGNLQLLYRAKPTSSTEYTIVSKITCMTSGAAAENSWIEIGIGVTEDVVGAPTTASIGYISIRYNTGAAVDQIGIIAQQWQDWDTYTGNLGATINAGSAVSSNTQDPSISKTIYLRLRKNGAVYGFDWSMDGRDWLNIYTGAVSQVTTNDTHIAIVFRGSGTVGSGRNHVQWFRVLDGVSDFYQAPIGRRFTYLAP